MSTSGQDILVRIFRAQQRPEIICLIGSTKFRDTFHAVNWELTMRGAIVLAPGVFQNEYGFAYGVKPALDELHKRKIDLSDGVVVVDNDDYIGESTKAEIDYAIHARKTVIYLSQSDLQGKIE